MLWLIIEIEHFRDELLEIFIICILINRHLTRSSIFLINLLKNLTHCFLLLNRRQKFQTNFTGHTNFIFFNFIRKIADFSFYYSIDNQIEKRNKISCHIYYIQSTNQTAHTYSQCNNVIIIPPSQKFSDCSIKLDFLCYFIWYSSHKHKNHQYFDEKTTFALIFYQIPILYIYLNRFFFFYIAIIAGASSVQKKSH